MNIVSPPLFLDDTTGFKNCAAMVKSATLCGFGSPVTHTSVKADGDVVDDVVPNTVRSKHRINDCEWRAVSVLRPGSTSFA